MAEYYEQEDDTQAWIEHLPHIENKPYIQSSLLRVQSFTRSRRMIKRNRCEDDDCFFCRNHVDTVTNDLCCARNSRIRLCRCKEVRFLLYCIHCDKVMMGYITREFKYLVQIQFGLDNISHCSERSHEISGIRCMLIDNGRKKKSEWENHLPVPEIDVSGAIGWKPLMECHLNNTWDDLNVVPGHPKASCIIYLIYCLKCKKPNCGPRYVGRTIHTFRDRYKKGLDSAQLLVYNHFKGNHSKCSAEHYKWMVIDSLSDGQILFLEKWEIAFNQFKVSEQKRVWLAINDKKHKSLKKDLVNLVDMSEPEEEKQLIFEMRKMLNENIKKLPKITFWISKNPDRKETSEFLKEASNMWINNTITLFLGDREKHWMDQLQTLESKRTGGLNKIASAKTKIVGGHFYINEFKNVNINA